MTDKDNRSDGKSGKTTLTLKAPSGLSSRGPSRGARTVVVERRTRRMATPGAAPAPRGSGTAEPVRPPRPAPRPAAAEAPAGGLTAAESIARERALKQAEARSVTEEADGARRRAEDEARRRTEREAAERARVDLEAKTKTEDRPRRVREEPKRPADKPRGAGPAPRTTSEEELERARRAAKPVADKPRKPAVGDDRRRTRLTIGDALSGDTERDRAPSLAALRRRREKAKVKTQSGPAAKVSREVVIPEAISVQELANRMAERSVDVIKFLMEQGQMATINDVLDTDTAELIVTEMGHTAKRVADADVETGLFDDKSTDTAADLTPRPPVVTIMGHVDHGKTSLLDAIRQTNVVSGEAGGITQHIGAYQVELNGQKITFLDTPGHEAFTAMRARGAQATDIAVLVVAANDGVKPQTVESIKHARAAGVPIIVADNKIDLPGIDPNKVRNDLLQHEIVVESLGGETQEVPVSATKKMNLDKLLEAIQLQAEVLELRANIDGRAEGIIIEAKLDRGRGAVATVLVQRGTLKVGDIVVAGGEWAKVRALIDDKGEQVKAATPSTPVEVLGFTGVPVAGDRFSAVESESRAREVTEYRARQIREKAAAGGVTSLEQMMAQLKTAGIAHFPLVIKGDVQGSVEAIEGALEKISTDEVNAQVMLAGVGAITESDVTLATASKAVIIGFNVRANKQARALAEREGIEIRYYNIIYNLVDDVKAAMSGLLKPERRETFIGNAEILEIFNISKVGKVAGCRVTEGMVERGAGVRLIREGVVIHEGKLSTLKRFKDEVREVQAGQECGMAFEKYEDMRQGDIIECFRVEEVTRTL